MLSALLTLLVVAQAGAVPQPSDAPAQTQRAPAQADQAETAPTQAAPTQVAPDEAAAAQAPEAQAQGTAAEAGEPGDGTADGAQPAAADDAQPVAATAAAEGEAPAEDAFPFTDAEPGTFWMPSAAADNTEDVDWLFYGILGLSAFCFAGVTIAVVFFAWRYRVRPGQERAQPSAHHNDVLEITWTVIPSIICVFIFVWGWEGFVNLNTPPKHAMEVGVTAQKWAWSFRYEKDLDSVIRPELHVPVDTPVRLVMRSEDVLHSLFVPSFRVKQDIVPNRYTKLWFKANKPGVYKLYCAEYCGQQHSDMKTKVVVHESGGYERWLETEYQKDQKDCAEEATAEAQTKCYEEQGLRIYESRGCAQCHSIDGSASTGPTFLGMYGEQRQFTDGSSGAADENYIRESIFEPQAKIRSGYNPVMPTFKGKLSDRQIDALINWLKTLK